MDATDEAYHAPSRTTCRSTGSGSAGLTSRLALHAESLFRYALHRIRNETEAQDLVQETFLAALQNIDLYRGQASERSWLMGILKHKISDYFRRLTRENRSFARETDVSDLEWCGAAQEEVAKLTLDGWRSEPEGYAEQKRFWEMFRSLLDSLPERHAMIFRLREVQGCNAEDICIDMNISRNNYWTMFYRARLQLKKAIERAWQEEEGDCGIEPPPLSGIPVAPGGAGSAAPPAADSPGCARRP